MAKIDDGLFMRGQVWQIRRVIPVDLQEYLGGGREMVKSLRTKDRGEACNRYKVEWAAFDSLFSSKRRQMLEERGPLTPASVRRIVIESDLRERASLFSKAAKEPAKFWSGEFISIPNTPFADHLKGEGYLEPLLGYCIRHRSQARAAALELSLTRGNLTEFIDEVGGDLIAARNLIIAKREALLEVAREEILSVQDKPSGATGAHTIAPPVNLSVQAIATDAGPMLSDVAVDWYKQKMRLGQWTDNTREDHEASIRNFIEVCGDRPIGGYTKAEARLFKDVLLRLPSNAHKREAFKNLPLTKMAQKADELPGLDRMATATVNKHLRKVSAFFSHCVTTYDECHSNPLLKMTDRMKVSQRDQRNPFDLGQLKAIFSAPIYIGCKSPARWHDSGNIILRDDGKFWVPLLGLYTGARLGEIVQLHINDVKEKDGVSYLDLCVTAEGDSQPKRLKNSSSRRVVPIHPELIAVGFLDFVKLRRGRHEVRLFPDVIKEGGKSLSDTMSKLFARMLDRLTVKTEKDVFHSFRHTFKDACRNSGVPEEQSKAFMGHEQHGESARYGTGFDLATLFDEIKKVSYAGLDLSHLKHGRK